MGVAKACAAYVCNNGLIGLHVLLCMTESVQKEIIAMLAVTELHVCLHHLHILQAAQKHLSQFQLQSDTLC